MFNDFTYINLKQQNKYTVRGNSIPQIDVKGVFKDIDPKLQKSAREHFREHVSNTFHSKILDK